MREDKLKDKFKKVITKTITLYLPFYIFSIFIILLLVRKGYPSSIIILVASISTFTGFIILYKLILRILTNIFNPLFKVVEHMIITLNKSDIEQLKDDLKYESQEIIKVFDDFVINSRDMRKKFTQALKKLSNLNEKLSALNKITTTANSLISRMITNKLEIEDVMRSFFSNLLKFEMNVKYMHFDGKFGKVEVGKRQNKVENYSTDYGVLTIGFTDSENGMSKVFKQVVLNEIMSFIRDVHMLKRISDLARYDELTNLYNRNHFIEILNLEIKKAMRYKREISLVLIDLDDFKNLNDNWGHQFGDEVLKVFARKLKDNFRESDILGRYGGDEFMLAIVESSYENSMKRMENFRRRSKNMEIKGIKVNLDFSFGIAQFPHDGRDFDELLRIADKRLYLSKSMKEFKNV